MPSAAGFLSCAAVIYDGALLALIPRENVAGSRFADYPGEGELVYVGALETELCPGALFAHRSLNGLTVAVELGADVTAADSPRRITPSPGRRSLRRWPPFPATVSSTDDALLAARYESKRFACGLVLAAPGKGRAPRTTSAPASASSVKTAWCLRRMSGRTAWPCLR